MLLGVARYVTIELKRIVNAPEFGENEFNRVIGSSEIGYVTRTVTTRKSRFRKFDNARFSNPYYVSRRYERILFVLCM